MLPIWQIRTEPYTTRYTVSGHLLKAHPKKQEQHDMSYVIETKRLRKKGLTGAKASGASFRGESNLPN